VITPVFNEGKVVFFVASRGHHADIGGTLPGKNSILFILFNNYILYINNDLTLT
jgi:N-methylhydantoinase B/oxoprolinase/acetone carboxylase alpha subunit